MPQQNAGALTATALAVIPVKNQGNGQVKTAIGAIPAGLKGIQLTIQCTTGDPANPFTGFQRPFNDPAMTITTGIDWSWDGGATYPQSTSGTQAGSPTGIFGTDRHGNPIMTPELFLFGFPSNDVSGAPPNAFRLTETINGGPITYGVTVNALT